MKNKYDLNFNIEHKKLKKFSISVGTEYFFCCSDFLKKKDSLNTIENIISVEKRTNEKKQFHLFNWEKKTSGKSEIVVNTNTYDDLDVFIGHVNLNKKDHFFILHGDEDAIWHEMPSLGFFKHETIYKHKLKSFYCDSGKISFFSDKFVYEDLKNKKLLHEFKVKKGKYSLFSMNIETEQFKKDFPYSNCVGALLVKD